MSYIIGLCRAKAVRWADAFFDETSIEETSYDEFLEPFSLSFTPVKNAEVSARKLWTIKQGNRSVAEFAVEFCILASESSWNAQALKVAV